MWWPKRDELSQRDADESMARMMLAPVAEGGGSIRTLARQRRTRPELALQPVIRVDELYKQYETAGGPFPVLKAVTLSIFPGEFVAVTGPSGSGKSTFMNSLRCVDLPT